MRCFPKTAFLGFEFRMVQLLELRKNNRKQNSTLKSQVFEIPYWFLPCCIRYKTVSKEKKDWMFSHWLVCLLMFVFVSETHQLAWLRISTLLKVRAPWWYLAMNIVIGTALWRFHWKPDTFVGKCVTVEIIAEQFVFVWTLMLWELFVFTVFTADLNTF